MDQQRLVQALLKSRVPARFSPDRRSRCSLQAFLCPIQAQFLRIGVPAKLVDFTPHSFPLDSCTSFHRCTAGVWSAVNLNATADIDGYIETPLA